MRWFTVSFIGVLIAVFLLTVVSERILIPILRSRKLGQKILDIGPRWHKSKEGTPTMGGIGFILASMLSMAVFFIVKGARGESAFFIPLSLTLAYAVGNGAIGFVDDYYKLEKKQNEGLTAPQKLLLQCVAAAAYVCVMSYTGNMSTYLTVPALGISWDLGVFWYPLAVLVLVGVVNGANFTDGLDGLASSVSLVIGIFLAVWAFTAESESLSMVAALLIGSTVGFLIFNAYPARVFMGDTGSLFLGALIISAALGEGRFDIGLVISVLFIVEMLSSFLQTAVFKITKRIYGEGKRIFRMAPLHHHFEKCGWSENKIVVIFSLVTALFCTLAWFML